MLNNWDTVQLLRLARHDWMNQLQLIKGHLSLNNVERVNEIIDELVNQSKHEAKLSNLQTPQLAAYLLTFNWNRHMFKLDYEFLCENLNLSNLDVPLHQFSKTLFHFCDELIKNPDDHHMLVTFHQVDSKVRIEYDFSGKLSNVALFEKWFTDINIHNSMTIIESYIQEEQFVISVEID